MTIPDMKDDEAVREWFLDCVYGETTQAATAALRSLCREVARKVAVKYATSQGVQVPEDGTTLGIAAALDSVCGPAPKGE